MKKAAFFIMALMIFSCAGSVFAEMVVVISNKSAVDKLSKQDVVNIYMGRYRTLPDGSKAIPIDLSASDPDKQKFYRRLLNKSLEEVNAYWARLIFSGRTMPPVELSGKEAILEFLNAHPGSIAYLDRRYVNKDVHAVYSLSDSN